MNPPFVISVELFEESSGRRWRRYHRRPVAPRDVRKVRKISPKRRNLRRRTPGRILAKNFGHPVQAFDRSEVRRKFAAPETSEASETRVKVETPPSQKNNELSQNW